MADILYMQDDDGDNSDEALDNTSDTEMGPENRDDFLPPLVRLQKYCNSDNIYHRQMVARMVLETLRAVADEPSDVASVIAVVNKLADDPDGPVRAELMEQVPHIAMLCHEDKGRLHSLVLDNLLPLIVKYLADNDNQVRKTSQAALIVLMEQGLLEQTAVEEKICPVILMLTEMDSMVEFHTGAVTLMSKMAPLIGRTSTERLFLSRFAAMCTDPVFYVRKVCAANFGEFCAVVGTDSTENVLLPRFVDLCEDEVWGVRKACAETFMSVSCACTLQTRKQSLAPVFANLLVDQSRWVRMSAFQTLGPFISTFADPSITGLSYNQDGELVILSPEGFEFRLTNSQLSENECARFPAAELKSCSKVKVNDSDVNKTDNLQYSESQDTCTKTTLKAELLDLYQELKNEVQNTIETKSDVNRTDNSIELIESQKTASSEEIDQCCEIDEEKECCRIEKETESRTNETSSSKTEDGSEPDLQQQRTADVPVDTLTEDETVDLKELETFEACEKESESNDSNELKELETNGSNAVIYWVKKGEVKLRKDCEVSEELGSGDAKQQQQLHVTESQGLVHIHVDNRTDSFNTFQYWRVPIPELELDISLANSGKPTSVNVKAKVTDKLRNCVLASELNVDMEIDTELDKLSTRLEECSAQRMELEKPIQAQICTSSVAMMTDSDKTVVTSSTQSSKSSMNWLNYGEMKISAPEKTFSCTTGEIQEPQGDVVQSLPQVSQDIVPQQLIDHFVSMTHPSQAHKTDNDIAHHCAYSLPAVALTLGRENWSLLKEAYSALASDMQWKVRRTVASSIHELAVILGEDLATKDLVPIFNGFIKDLDEVRIGALKHLAEFLKLLRPEERNTYLPRLAEFLLTDNEWNWRFREELAEQLLEAIHLFSPEGTKQHLTSIAISLLLDKVAAVRQVALSLVTELVRHVSMDASLLRSLLAELAEWFAHSKRWNRRQTFALLCSHLVVKHVLSEEIFAKDVLPHLLDLSWDPVPNVRLSVARTLSTNIMTQEFFSSEGNPHHEILLQVLKRLQTDADRDVRYFASLCPNTTIEEDSAVSGDT